MREPHTNKTGCVANLGETVLFSVPVLRQYAAEMNGSVHVLLHWYVMSNVHNEHNYRVACQRPNSLISSKHCTLTETKELETSMSIYSSISRVYCRDK
jgi:hypothetical protein